MRKDFCAFILTHGRPDRVYTYDTIRRHGYTGDIYLVVDDKDKTLPEYQKRYGKDSVLVFSKDDIVKTFDEGDNFQDRRAIIYARNATFGLAKELGYNYFIQLDDDYSNFEYRFNADHHYGYWYLKDLDHLLEGIVEYLSNTPFLTIAMSQGGDHIAGGNNTYTKTIRSKRKAMNTFVCKTDRPFQFVGRINEDVNTYTNLQRRGGLFLTLMVPKVVQKDTQSNAGGMTDLYLDTGTYTKSFYTVMYTPSAVKVGFILDSQKTAQNLEGKHGARIHHRIRWTKVAPLILDKKHKKEK